MSNKVFVGGISWNTTDDSLRVAFEKFGTVEDARIIMDRETGRSRGFGFVTFTEPEAIPNAIKEMDGTELDGRVIRVNEAQEKRSGGGGGGGGGGHRGGRDRY